MSQSERNPFSEHYVADPAHAAPPRGTAVMSSNIQVLMSQDLEQDLVEWGQRQYVCIGSAEFVEKGSQGVGVEARSQASLVGAALVLFRLWPAKLKSIRRKTDGTIDIAAVTADPPVSLSPRGYYVVRAMFLRPNP